MAPPTPKEESVIVDTSDRLTLEELRELKKLAQLSRTTRVAVSIMFAIVGTLGLPVVLGWFNKHWN